MNDRLRLVVNADDFGLTPGVNRSVGELYQAGALSSSTLMASGAAFEDAVAVARQHPGLGVGCHVVLVDGSPCAPREAVPTLLQSDGRLRSSLAQFIVKLQSKRISESEIQIEAEAQIARLQEAGLNVTHIDTHKHTHLFPRVARPLLRAAMARGVGAVRNPFEPAWSARLTRGALLRKLEVKGLRGFLTSFDQLRRASGLRSTDGSIGVSATGSLDGGNLERLLQDAPAGTWELVCHPGYDDADLRGVKTRLRATREVERRALLVQLPEAIRSGRVELIRFSDI